MLRKAKSLRQATDVRVDDNSGGNSIGHAEYDVRSLARNPGKFQQLFHCLRHAPVEFFDQHLARALN